MSEKRKSLHQRLVEAECELDRHESDLYVRRTREVEQIIREFEAEGGISNKEPFISAIDGTAWYDLPFHYQPYWDAKLSQSPASEKDDDTPPAPKM